MLQYILPEYAGLDGDCCIVCDSDIETVHKKKIHPIIRELFRRKYIDPVALKHTFNLMLDQKNLIPLIYSSHEIMIPVKVRKALIHNDPSYGYVNIFAIMEITDKHSFLLNNGKEIVFLDNIRTIKKRIKMAEQMISLNKTAIPFLHNKLLIIPLNQHYEELYYDVRNILYPTEASLPFKHKKPLKS